MSDDESVLMAMAEDEIIDAVAAWAARKYGPKTPQSTSVLTGKQRAQELMDGNKATFLTRARMPKECFRVLRDQLIANGDIVESRKVSADMALLLFLGVLCQSDTVRTTRDLWQVSASTVHRHFHRVLHGVLKLAPEYIKFPAADYVAPEISDDERRRLYFGDAVGAIDGTHIKILVEESASDKWRNKKVSLPLP